MKTNTCVCSDSSKFLDGNGNCTGCPTGQVMKYIPAFDGSNTSYCGCPDKQVLKNGSCVVATCAAEYDRIKGVDPVKAAKDIGQFKVMDGKNNAWAKVCD